MVPLWLSQFTVRLFVAGFLFRLKLLIHAKKRKFPRRTEIFIQSSLEASDRLFYIWFREKKNQVLMVPVPLGIIIVEEH